MRNASRLALNQAKEIEKGRFYNCMSVIIYSAFCIEGYLNHVGAKIIESWDILERKLSPEEKLQIIYSKLHIFPDKGKRPYQTIKDIFQIRNLFAHPRTEYISETKDIIGDLIDPPDTPLLEWEKNISIEFAEKCHKDTKKVIEEINRLAKLPETPLLSSGHVDWTKTHII